MTIAALLASIGSLLHPQRPAVGHSPITAPEDLGELPILDMPAMPVGERRAEAESWMTAMLSAYALPTNNERNTTIQFGFCETSDEINENGRSWSQTRMDYWNNGFGDILDALDTWPADQPVTLWMVPNARIVQLM